MSRFVTFRTLYSEEAANQMAQFFEQHQIPCKLGADMRKRDHIFIGGIMDFEYYVQIEPDDFDRANQLLDQEAEGELKDVPDDYYLYDFTMEELQAVRNDRSKWSNLDYVLAGKLLQEKQSASLTPEAAAPAKTAAPTTTVIREPRAHTLLEIVLLGLGYALLFFYPLIPVVGGLLIARTKKPVAGGKTQYEFSQPSRVLGYILSVCGLLFFLYFLFGDSFHRLLASIFPGPQYFAGIGSVGGPFATYFFHVYP